MGRVAKRFNQFGIVHKLFNRVELEGCGVSPNDDIVSVGVGGGGLGFCKMI